MSIIGSNILAGASGQVGGGYTIENSLRFRSSASAYLSRTPASAGNRKTWTWSSWVKRGVLSSSQPIFCTGTSGSSYMAIATAGDYITLNQYTGSYNVLVTTSAVLRDPSAWYHLVFVLDTTQATSTDRVKIYINGTRQTSFVDNTFPSLNYDGLINSATASYIGQFSPAGYAYFDGYLTEANFIDGQALTPSDFGEYNEDTGVWQPVAYEGTYGTNGFYLPFSDATNTTTLAADASGNGNDWTPNNISLTSGVTYDSMTDTPTIYAGGGNYAVLNPLDKVGSGVLTDANLDYATSSGTFDPLRGTIGVSSGKWYWEVTCKATSGASPNTFTIGIASQSTNINDASWYVGKDAASYSYYGVNGVKYNNNASTAYGASYTTGDVIGVALDMDAGTLVFYKNNTSQGTAFSSLVGTFMPAFSDGATSGTVSVAFNFGQRPFAYTPPAGFLPLHTGNLPDSAIVDGSEYFNTVLYTGTGPTPLSVTGVGFQPDLVWVKKRNTSTYGSHQLVDSVRGTSAYLFSDATNSEGTATDRLTAFNSNGFTLSTASQVNGSADTFVGWTWKANGAGVSNDEGSITSTVSANLTSGFSIVTYTGTGADATVGHGLGAVPKMIISKRRDTGPSAWVIALDWSGFTWSSDYYQFDTGLKRTDGASTVWRQEPTSSVFSVGSAFVDTGTFVAYCFAEVPSFSKMGSYVGNGLSDGPFVYLGFRPAFVMIKVSSIAGYDWLMYDSSRDTYNVTALNLRADLPDEEGSQIANYLDFLSNGFKIRGSSIGSINPSQTIIYMAFAENPFKNSLAR